MNAHDENPASMEELKSRVEDLFLRVCGDPDDTETAAAADSALHELDQMLAG